MNQQHLDDLALEVRDLRAAVRQLQDCVVQIGGAPPPPKHLQIRVVGRYHEEYFQSGDHIADDLERELAPFSRTLRDFPTILDYGCGCGRIVSAVSRRLLSSQRLCGCDIDHEAIGWCQANYSRLAEFAATSHVPPTPYRDGQFSLVYSISVFTHLPESMQHAWWSELHRITAPGGYLVMSVHGPNHLPHFPAEAQQAFAERGFCYADLGKTDGLPDFYLTTCHSERYVREQWSRYVDVLGVSALAIDGRQDAVVCRRRAD
jgi:SAM-dependent methyltransferase